MTAINYVSGIKAKSTFKPSAYQQGMADWVHENIGQGKHVIVQACAGSGKTTSSVWIFNDHLPKDIDTVFVAFNSHIANALKEKLPDGSNARTYHSLGLQTLKKNIPNLTVDQDKVESFLRGAARFEKWVIPSTKKLVGLCKSGIDSDFDDNDLMRLAFAHDIDLYDDNGNSAARDKIFDYVHKAIYFSLNHPEVVDFDDMIWLPNVLEGIQFQQFDFILGDEFQDTNRGQMELILQSVKQTGNIVGVGDRHQCQPGDVKVCLTGGNTKYIKDLMVGDMLVSYASGKSNFRGVKTQGRRVEDVVKRVYYGNMLTLQTESYTTRCTPEHRIMAKMKKGNYYTLYLMRKGNKYRVGISKSFYNQDGRSGMGMRARQEDADAVWILNAYDTKDDARRFEIATQVEFGIPSLIWKSAGTEFASQEFLDSTWDMVQPNEDRAIKCLTNFGRRLEFPIWSRVASNPHYGGKTFIIQACNLLSKYMEMRTFDGTVHGGRWETVYVTNDYYKGYVYSLKVEPTEGGRRLYVADGLVVHNSIYAFRGASSTAMDNLKERLGADELPLSLSYRCPVAVKELVNQKFPHIRFEVPEWAKPGKVYDMLDRDVAKNIQPDDMVLCRVNADLIPLAFSLIRSGIKATVKGRDIGKGLTALIKKSKADSVPDLMEWLYNWKAKEIEKAMRMNAESKIGSIQDKIETIVALADDADTVAQVVGRCDEIFSDEKSAVTLSTIHKAKGNEAERVFILRPDLLPHPAAKREEDKRQEENLTYVCYTRSRDELIFIR